MLIASRPTFRTMDPSPPTLPIGVFRTPITIRMDSTPGALSRIHISFLALEGEISASFFLRATFHIMDLFLGTGLEYENEE